MSRLIPHPFLVLGIEHSALTPMPPNLSGASTIPNPDVVNTTGINFSVTFTGCRSSLDRFQFVQTVVAVRESRWSKSLDINQEYPQTDLIELNTESEGSELSGYFTQFNNGEPFVDCDPDRTDGRYDYGKVADGVRVIAAADSWWCLDRPRGKAWSTKWSEFERSEGFNMHVMYRPDTRDRFSIFVAMKTFRWGFFASATQMKNADGTFNSQWEKNPYSFVYPVPEYVIDSIEQPHWLGNIKEVHVNGSDPVNLQLLRSQSGE